MSPILGIVGGVVGLFLVWFFMIRKKGKTQTMQPGKNTNVKKVSGEVLPAVNKKEQIIDQLIARGALTKEEAGKVRASIRGESSQPQTTAIQVITNPKVIPVVDQSAVAIMSEKYRAMVISEGVTNITFKFIPKKLGNPMYLEQSMPSRGAHLVVVEKDGNWSAYDPRLEAFASSETPQRAYTAVNCYEIVSAVYANKLGLWEKFNMILIALVGCGFILVAIVAIDKLG
jgi:hypothetical protein